MLRKSLIFVFVLAMRKLLIIVGFSIVTAQLPAQTDTTSLRLNEVQVVDSHKHHTMTSTAPLYVMDHGEMLRMGVIVFRVSHCATMVGQGA